MSMVIRRSPVRSRRLSVCSKYAPEPAQPCMKSTARGPSPRTRYAILTPPSVRAEVVGAVATVMATPRSFPESISHGTVLPSSADTIGGMTDVGRGRPHGAFIELLGFDACGSAGARLEDSGRRRPGGDLRARAHTQLVANVLKVGVP